MPEHILSDFTLSADTKIGTGAKFSHTVMRGTLYGINKQWICKEAKTPADARLEALAQEFIRLIIPHQPETRIARNMTNGTYHILSEEVLGYRNLPTGQQRQFTQGTYPGLGQAMLCSMLLQEIDLKNGNIGLDKHGRVIKIDGDWCFAELRNYSGQYPLSEAAIAYLPEPIGYTTFNWLDLFEQGVAKERSNIVDAAKLSNAPHFRAEVNQALLKICLIPEQYLEKFVDAYMPVGGQRFLDLLKSRQTELKLSAFKNSSFLEYLKSEQAVADTQTMTEQLMEFTVAGVPLLQNTEKDSIKAMIPIFSRTAKFRKEYESQNLLSGQKQLSENYQDNNVKQHAQELQAHIEEQPIMVESFMSNESSAVSAVEEAVGSKLRSVSTINAIREHTNPIVNASGETAKAERIITQQTTFKSKLQVLMDKQNPEPEGDKEHVPTSPGFG